jgi:hypothetical protein
MKQVILILALSLVFAHTALAATPQTTTAQEQRALEIETIMTDARARVDELLRTKGSDLAGPECRETQQHISRIKREAQIAVFEVQLRFAREDNHPELILKLEELIEHLRTPRDHRTGPGQPLDKPAHR